MNRSFILGIAITMVIIYHLFSWVYNPIGRLNIGYVGVDIFLFFSGFGLSFSFHNNSLKEFYKRRLRKVYPLYFIVSILTIIITTTQYAPISKFILDSVSKLTTLSYYFDTQNSIDWYLNSLFLFYLLFPVLYKLSRKYGFTFYIISVIICVLIETVLPFAFNYKLHWQHDCFISRIPIFCLGIIFATHNFNEKSVRKFALWNVLLFIPLYYFSPFLSVSFFAPLLILIANKLSHQIKSDKLEYIGNHTLELYCANLIVLKALDFTDSVFLKLFLFIIVQIIMSAFFIYINKRITNSLNNFLH